MKNQVWSKSLRKCIAILLTLVMLLMSMPMIALADSEDYRVYGDNRYGTSYAVADALYKKTGSFDNIVVAFGGNFPDALSGGYLAKVKNAPLLLINPSEEAKVLQYIKNHMKPNGTVYLLGGTGVIRSEFEKSLKNQAIKVKRLWGQGRYDTNLEILKESVKPGEEILVATGANYADSLSGSSVGKGMLLVGKGLTADQVKWIQNAGIKKFYILGGTGAVSSGIEAELKKFGKVERLGGKNRYETSYLIAKMFFPKSDSVTLVSGKNFPDGLSGAPLAMLNDSSILLVSEGNTQYANQYVNYLNIDYCTIIGGVGAVPKKVAAETMGRDVGEATPNNTQSGFALTKYNSNISYYVSDGQKIKSIELNYVEQYGHESMFLEWDGNKKSHLTLIAAYGPVPFTKEIVDDCVSTYPDIWKDDITEIYEKPEVSSGVGFEKAGLEDMPVYVLLLSMDRNYKVVRYTIVRIEKLV